MTIERRVVETGLLDEVVAHNAFVHLENLGNGSWYLGIDVGDKQTQIFIHATKICDETGVAWTLKRQKELAESEAK